jgi:pimeloyl-ACP methyl ester carboxylesterase
MEQRRIEVDGVPLHYQVAGAGEPVILVHGLSGSTRWWARNVPALARHFRVYVVDLIGFGQSRGRHPFVLEQAGDSLARWMELADIGRASIVGHSMGGFIALDLAAEFPDRIERLVLVDAAVLPRQGGYARHALGLVRALRHMPLGFLPILITDTWRAGPVTILKAAGDLLTADVRPELARVRAPTLLVWGEHDALVPVPIGEELRGALPQARLVVLKGAGHNPMWDRAEAFNRVALDFLGAGAQAICRHFTAALARAGLPRTIPLP